MSTMQTTSGPSGTFVPPELFAKLGSMSQADADSCGFGVIKLADDGTIELYNRWQGELAGVQPQAVTGKNWFTQVAPCTNNGLVFGQFKKGVAAGNLNAVFPYTFTFKMKPTNVKLHLYRDQNTSTNWVFCTNA
mgnify:CR=1 FL=1